MKKLILTTAVFNVLFTELTTFFQFQKGLNSTDAQDLATDVLLKAEKTFDTDKNTEFRTHVLNVSRTMVIDYFRDRKATFHNSMMSIDMMNDDSEDNVFQIEDTTLNVEEQILADDNFLPLKSAIKNSLNETQQLIIEEHYFNGLKVHEIAKKHNLNQSTIKVNLKRSREILLRKLS